VIGFANVPGLEDDDVVVAEVEDVRRLEDAVGVTLAQVPVYPQPAHPAAPFSGTETLSVHVLTVQILTGSRLLAWFARPCSLCVFPR
jgi:hypothetical protein